MLSVLSEVGPGLGSPYRGKAPPAPSTGAERTLELLAKRGLRRKEGESALTYAERVLEALRGAKYDVNAQGSIWATLRGGCEEYSQGFRDALRAHGIPCEVPAALFPVCDLT